MDIVREHNLTKMFGKIKIGNRFKFVVTEVDDNQATTTMCDYPEIKGKVDYEAYLLGYSLIPDEHFEIGDVFEGEVLGKEIGRTLIIKPILNLKEQKNKKKSNDLLEKWKRNEL